jgi:hypothetical protein
MSLALGFVQKWSNCYRVLRHANGFGFVDAVCYGLWLARG